MQPVDDDNLLDQMMSDLRQVPREYQPTQYWENNEAELVAYLKEYGLKDFRRQHSTGARNILLSFGATDLLRDEWTAPELERTRIVSNRIIRRTRQLSAASRHVGRFQRNMYLRRMSERYRSYGSVCLAFAEQKGAEWGAKSVKDLHLSMIGNPEDRFDVDDRAWSYTMLNFYMRYAWVSRFVDFDSIGSIAELGSGSGKQAEVLAKLHPNLTLFLYDIPPQLYVAHQYLKAVFPDRLVQYGDDLNVESGSINLLPSWLFPDIKAIRPSLFWNAASFQEMEPDVVRNYLRTVDEAAPDHIYLMERMEGMPTGVDTATMLQDYVEGLPSYSLMPPDPSQLSNGQSEAGYSDSYWRRAAVA